MTTACNFRPITARLFLCLLAFVLLSCTTPQAAVTPFQNNTVPENLGEPALINVNGYYLLYMYPVSPFESESQVFVPLYRFARMLTSETSFFYKQGSEGAPVRAEFDRENVKVSIDNQSVITITDTQTGQTTTPDYSGKYVWREIEDNLNGVYIPLNFFRDAFGIGMQYKGDIDTYFVTDPKAVFTERIDGKLYYDVQSTPIIHPSKVSLEVMNKPNIYERSEFRLTLEIKADDSFSGKAEDISVALPALYDSATLAFAGDTTIRPFVCQTSAQKNTFVCTENFMPDQAISGLGYIFSRIGVRIK